MVCGMSITSLIKSVPDVAGGCTRVPETGGGVGDAHSWLVILGKDTGIKTSVSSKRLVRERNRTCPSPLYTFCSMLSRQMEIVFTYAANG